MRLGFFARAAATVAILLLAMQLFLVYLVSLQSKRDAEQGFRFPLPDRVAAIVELVEQSKDASTLLQALNGPHLSVALDDAPFDLKAANDTRLPSVERELKKFENALSGRAFAAYIALPEGVSAAQLRRGDRSLWSQHPLRIVVALDTGRTLTIETRKDLVTQVYSVPIGFWSGVFGLISGVIVLLFLRRETAPLRQLAQSAAHFADNRQPKPVRPRGAAEVRALIDASNHMQDRIADLLKARQLMLGALGHDLRTYLTRFQLKLHAAGVETLDADVAEMDAILENCLTLAKSGRGLARVTSVDVAGLVERLVETEQGNGRSIDLHLPQMRPQPVQTDPNSLERVLQNLIDNAFKYGSEPSIHLRQTAKHLQIEIADKGPGIPKHQHKQAFEAFETLDQARTKPGVNEQGGHGLGLAISKALLDDMGGELSLHTNATGGLVVKISLPKA